MTTRILFAALLMLTTAVAQPAIAQSWPDKNVRIVVPFGPGSTPDTVARVIADQLKARHPGLTVLVENKPGASGNLGTDTVAKAAPDGQTIGISIGGPLAINTLLFSKLPYDPQKDIAPVTQLITQASVLTATPSLNVKTVADLVTLLKNNPGKYNFSSIGNGSLSHLAMEAIAIKSGTKLVHVPYTSSPQAVTAVIRGDAQLACLPAISVVPQAEAGKVAMLAVSTAKRSTFLPNVPTLKESGIDVEADAWMGLIAPGGTPKPLVDAISKEVVAIIKLPDVRQKLATQFMEPVGSTPEEFRMLIDNEIARWAPVIKAADVKVN
ncbi:MAG: tripartite tricarboxylate transporter substrate binding protein [Rhizobiales bacterium]|nr:tripartite tricarboxylate transporter substrate binding protein [Hyphomicrobiales bacterium]OJY46057.1 MAG: ABC transporter substrate-binding protein [Rhizobiales bacterium 64-17]